MNANEIAFGIEFETTLPSTDNTPIGPYHSGYQVPWLPTGWKAERDGSIRPENTSRKGCEFVSPILKGAEGVRQIENAIECMKKDGTMAAMHEKWFGYKPAPGSAAVTIYPGTGVPDMPGYDPTPREPKC